MGDDPEQPGACTGSFCDIQGHIILTSGAAASQVPPGSAVFLWWLLLEQWSEQAAIRLAVKAAHKPVLLCPLPQIHSLEHLPQQTLSSKKAQYLPNIQ